MVDEFTRLQRERVNDGELEGAQDYMVGHFPLTIEVPDAIATQVLNQLFYELPVDDLPRYRERILKVTPVDGAHRVTDDDGRSQRAVPSEWSYGPDLSGPRGPFVERIRQRRRFAATVATPDHEIVSAPRES